MAVTISQERSSQQDDPRPVKFDIGSYVIEASNTAYYSTDDGGSWYTIKTGFNVTVRNSKLSIALQNGTGTVTVTEIPSNAIPFK